MSKIGDSEFQTHLTPHMVTGFSDGFYNGENNLKDKQLVRVASGNHRVSSKFTSHLAQFGPWTDTSINAATRSQTREEVVQLRRDRSMLRVQSNFSAEARLVEKLQRQLAKKQSRMAYDALEIWAAMKVQIAWRKRIAARSLREKKSERLLALWITFRVLFKRRYHAAIFLQHNMRILLGHKALGSAVVKLIKGAKIVTFVRRILARRCALKMCEIRRFTMRTVSISIDYGSYHIIQKVARERFQAAEASRNGLLCRFMRRVMHHARRRLLLKHGKVAFDHLIHDVPRLAREQRRTTIASKKAETKKGGKGTISPSGHGNYILAYLKARHLAQHLGSTDTDGVQDSSVASSRRLSGKATTGGGKGGARGGAKAKGKGGKALTAVAATAAVLPARPGPTPLPFFLSGYFSPRGPGLLEVVRLFQDIQYAAQHIPALLSAQDPAPMPEPQDVKPAVDKPPSAPPSRRSSGTSGRKSLGAEGRGMGEGDASVRDEDDDAHQVARIASGLMDEARPTMAAAPPAVPRPSQRAGHKSARKLVPAAK